MGEDVPAEESQVTATPVEEDEEDGPLEDWTVKELKDECKTLGLSDKGKKAELIDRIKDFRAASEAPAEAVEEADSEDVPMEEAPLEEAIVEETPPEDTPPEDTPPEDTPIAEEATEEAMEEEAAAESVVEQTEEMDVEEDGP